MEDEAPLVINDGVGGWTAPLSLNTEPSLSLSLSLSHSLSLSLFFLSAKAVRVSLYSQGIFRHRCLILSHPNVLSNIIH